MLKRGVLHSELPGAQLIGGGCFRRAYRVGEWVVKETSDDTHASSTEQCHIPRSVAQRRIGVVPITLAPTIYVRTHNRRYMIQPYIEPMSTRGTPTYVEFCKFLAPFKTRLDLHDDNVGFDAQGGLVAFDW